MIQKVEAMEKWYAIQVRTGQEDAVCFLVAQTAKNIGALDAFDELFAPKRQILKKLRGEIIEGVEQLLPGYIIAVCRPAKLDLLVTALRKSSRFARLIGQSGATFVPLSDEEVSWICAFTQRGDRTVEISEGFVEGGCVKIVSGPLVGKEGLIRKVNRRKGTASLELQILGRAVEVKVGLNLVKKVNK